MKFISCLFLSDHAGSYTYPTFQQYLLYHLFYFPKFETQRKDTKLTVALTSPSSCRSIRFDPSISLIFFISSQAKDQSSGGAHSKGFTKEENNLTEKSMKH